MKYILPMFNILLQDSSSDVCSCVFPYALGPSPDDLQFELHF